MDVNQIFFIGHNKYGQAGIGQEQHNKKFSSPKQIVFKTFIKQVSCGNHHSALLTIEGLIYTMGSNIHGTLGLGNGGSINYAFRPSLVKQLRQVDQIFSGSYHMCAVKQGQLYTWGKGIDGQLGHGNMKNVFVPTKVQALGNDVENVSCGLNHTLVIVSKKVSNLNKVNILNKANNLNGYAFGSGIYGQLGSGSNRSYNYPVNIKLCNIQSVSAGENHSLFISQSKVFGCGDNSNFQMGNLQDSTKNKKYMLEPQKLQFFCKQEISLIDCYSLSAVLTCDGKAFAWGGKDKIWPPLQIQQDQVLNIKVASQRIYFISNKNQVTSLTFSSKQNNRQQKQVILPNRNIMDFDAGQNHLLALGDIVAQTQQKQQSQVLSLWKGQSLNSSKQTFSQKQLGVPKQQLQPRKEPIQQKHKIEQFFFTKHLKSGMSQFQQVQNQQQGQKQNSFKYSCHNAPGYVLDNTIQNYTDNSSSVEIEAKNILEVNDSQIRENFGQNGYYRDNQSPKINVQSKQFSAKINFPNTTCDSQATKFPQNKLKRFMQKIQQKTVHLKRSYSNQGKQLKSGQDKEKSVLKTPGSHITKEPERFNLEQQVVDCSNLIIDPKIQNLGQKLKISTVLKQNRIENSRNQIKEIKRQKTTKSVIYYNEKQNEKQRNPHLEQQKVVKSKRQQQKIESIFRQLLRKHHRQQVQKQPTIQSQQLKHKQLDQIIRRKRLSSSCISSKISLISASRLQKQRIQSSQMPKNSKIKRSPYAQNMMAVSKISSHSNISSKSNIKKNADLLQMSRSNRQLRYELRDRDFKISQLQDDLSKKEIEVEMLYKKLEEFKNRSSA